MNSIDSNAKFMDFMKAAGEDNTANRCRVLEFHRRKAVYMIKDAGMLLSNEYGNAEYLSKRMKTLQN